MYCHVHLVSLYSAQIITECLKVKKCEVRMACSDITIIQTVSPQDKMHVTTACKQVVRCPC
jgi:hypothetical protein